MKIAVFHNLPIGGAKRVLHEEVKYLSKKHELHLYTMLSSDKKQIWAVEPYMEKVYRFNFEIKSNLPGFLARLEKDYQNFVTLTKVHQEIAKKINKGNYDAVLVHADKYTQTPFLLRYLTVPSAYYCMELLRIAYERELEFDEQVNFLKRWYERMTRKIRKKIDLENARSTDLIVAISNFTKRDIKKAYRVNSRVCYPGVDTEVFKPSSKKNKGFVLYVGSKIALEGYDLAKEGFGEMLDKYKDKFPDDIKPKFEVLSFDKKGPKITDIDLAKKYSQASVTLVPTMNETFGLIPLESMACETPVIALDEAAPKETMISGKTGYLLKRNPKEIAGKLFYLLTNPEVGKKMGKFCRKHAVKNFSWEKHNRLLEKYLKEVAGAKN